MSHSETGASLSSTTRLSASAKPFTFNRGSQQCTLKVPVNSGGQEPDLYSPDYRSSDPFGSLLDSFPKFNSGAKGNIVSSSNLGNSGFPHEAVAATFPIELASQTQADDASLSQHPSMDFEVNDDFVVINESEFDMPNEFSLPLPAYCSSTTGLGSGTCTGFEFSHENQQKDCHEGLFGAGNDGGGLASSGGIHIKGKMQGAAESGSVMRSNSDTYPFVFSASGMSSSTKLNNVSHGQGCHMASGATCSAFISSGAPDGQYFSEVLSSTINNASHSIGSLPSEIHGPSSHCSVLLPFDASRNMDLLTGGWGTVDDEACSSSIVPGPKDPYHIFNAEGKGTDDGDTEMLKIGKSVSLDARDHLKSGDTSWGFSIQTSKSLGDSDSDLDSPCWKGKKTSSQFPSEILGSVQTLDLEKELKKTNTLNPLAPHFFPGNAEGSSLLSSKKVKGDFVSSESSPPLAANLFSNLLLGENKQMKTAMADAHPVELKGIELLHSNNMNESVKAFSRVSDPKCSLLLNSTCMTQPSSTENFSTKEKTEVVAGNVGGCSKEAKDDMSKEITRDSFPVMYHSPSSSSPEAVLVANLFEKLEGLSKSLSDSPELDVQTMINAMRILSEMLVRSCVHPLDSYKQHNHDTIQHIINNLNEFSAIYSGQMIPAVQSTQTGNLELLGRSLELPKHSKKGTEEASVETFSIPKKLNQNDNGGKQNNVSSSDVGPEKGNEILHVIRRNLDKNLHFKEHLHPQALLYKNLWLDAEAAMCHMRRKIYLRLMETGMDVNHTDLEDLWSDRALFVT